MVVHIGICIINTTEHYNFCDLGELLRQVLWVLPPDVAFCDLRILESRTRGLCILAGKEEFLTSSLTVVPVRVCGSYTHCADATVSLTVD